MPSRHTSILVWVGPPLLGTLLGRLLEAPGRSVTVVDPGFPVPPKAFDVAVVTKPNVVSAGAVITLPNLGRRSFAGSVSVDGISVIEPMRTPDDVVRLVDRELAAHGTTTRSP